MALEMKMGDMVLTGAYLLFVIGIVAGFITSADSSLGTTTLSSDFNSLESDYKNDYDDMETGLQTLTSNTTGFVVQENIFIDERGTGEADFSKDNTQKGFKNFISKIFGNSNNGGLIDIRIKVYAISFVVLVSIILGLRMILGNGRV